MIRKRRDESNSLTKNRHTKRFHLPVKLFRNHYRYEPETGKLFRKKSGKAVGWRNGSQGLITEMRCRGVRYQYYVHRIIVYMHTGIDPIGYDVLHLDGNNENNVYTNLTGNWLRSELPEDGRLYERTLNPDTRGVMGA
jgi:hypothetical protein